MAITEVGTPHQSSGWGTAASDTHGIAITSGDVIVCFVFTAAAAGVTCADNNGAASFAQDLAHNGMGTVEPLYIFSRTAGASEHDHFDFTLSGGDANWTQMTRVFRGVDNANHWDSIANHYSADWSGAATTWPAPTITTGYAGSLAIAYYRLPYNTQTFSSIDNGFAGALAHNAAYVNCATYTKTITDAGAVGATTVTFNVASDWAGGGLIALRMAVAGFTGLTVTKLLQG